MAVELATGYVTIIPSAKGFKSAIAAEIGGDMDAAGGDAGDKAAKGFGSRFSSGLKSVAKVAAVGFGLALAGAVAFGKGAIDAASDLSESQSKVNVVFGESAGAVTKFAQAAATGLGQSTQQALEATGTFGNLMQAFGIARGPAAEMSTSLVTLATDLASFNNTSVEDALAALQSGLSGEAEPMRKYGASLSDVRLKQKALELGLISSVKDGLDPAARAQAAYALIMDDTKLAQGDFARTSDGLANQQRILAAQFENSRAAIGSALLPIITKVVSLAAGALPKAIAGIQAFASAVAEGFSSRAVSADGIIGVFQQIGLVVHNVVDAVIEAWPTAQRIFAQAGAVIVGVLLTLKDALVATFNYLNENREVLVAVAAVVATALVVAFVAWAASAIAAAVATIAAAAPVILLGAAIAALVGGLIYAYQHFEAFRAIVDTVAAAVVVAFQAVVDWVGANWRPIWDGIVAVVQVAIETVRSIIETTVGIINAIWDAFGQYIMAGITMAWDYIRSQVEAAINIVRGIIQTVTALIQGDWSGVWEGIKQILSGVWEGIKSTVQLALSAVQLAISGAWAAVKGLTSAAWDGIKSAVSSAVGGVVDLIASLPGKAGSALSSLGSSLLEKVNAAATAVKDGISTLIGDAVDLIRGLPGKMVSALSSMAGTVASAAKAAFKSGVNSAIQAINDFLPNSVGFGPISIDLPDNPIPTMHTGGIVPGMPGTEVPALLEAGELVVSRADLASGNIGGGGTGVSIGTLVAADTDDAIRKLELMAWRQRMAGVAA